MNSNSIPPLSPAEIDPSPEPQPKFNIFLAYSDFNTALRGKQLYEQIIKALGHEFNFSVSLWKFDILNVTRLSALASFDAANADMLIISTHGGYDLPSAVKSCVREGLQQKRLAPAALVALLDDEEVSLDHFDSNLAWLRDLANRYHWTFFAHTDHDVTEPETTSDLELEPLDLFWKSRREWYHNFWRESSQPECPSVARVRASQSSHRTAEPFTHRSIDCD